MSIPCGGPWGGEKVDDAFLAFLRELLGPKLSDESAQPQEFYEIKAQFSAAKINYSPGTPPASIRLLDVLENKRQLETLATAYNAIHPDTPITKMASQRNGFLTMSEELMLSFFEPSLDATVAEVRRVLGAVPNVNCIVVVGGYGGSKVITSRIKHDFHGVDGRRVIVPDVFPRPQAAVVQGTVLFGLRKDVVVNRLSPRTYGVDMVVGKEKNHFRVFATKGQELPLNHEATVVGWPLTASQRDFYWEVYCSDKLRPAVVTGERKLGALTVNCPPHIDQDKRAQTAVFCFGRSEIAIKIRNAVGEEVEGSIAMV